MAKHVNSTYVLTPPQQVHNDIVLAQPSLIAPVNNTAICLPVGTAFNFFWYPVADATFYIVQVCMTSSFVGPTMRGYRIPANGNGVQQIVFQTGQDIGYNYTYYWRVIPYNETGGAGPTSDAWQLSLNCSASDRDSDKNSNCTKYNIHTTVQAAYGLIKSNDTNEIRASVNIGSSQVSVVDWQWSVTGGNSGGLAPWPGSSVPNLQKKYTPNLTDSGDVTIQLTVDFRDNEGNTFSCSDSTTFTVSQVKKRDPYFVFLIKVGGTDGNASTGTYASWTYDAYGENDDGSKSTTKLNTAGPLSPENPRFVAAATTPATKGLARNRGDGTMVLTFAYEQYGVGGASLPNGGYKYMVLERTADGPQTNNPAYTGGTAGWDWVRAHGGITPTT